MMSTIDNVRLPDSIEQGAQGGPTFYTSILRMSSGAEVRNQNWVSQKNAYDVAYGMQSKTDFQTVMAFFYARRGRARGFLFKDWSDFDATLQTAAEITATTYQLQKIYTDDASLTFVRKITRPVVGSVTVFYNGAPMASGWSLDYTTGLITFTTAPVDPTKVSASFEFDIPVRFDTDEFKLTLQNFNAGAIPSLPIVELLS